MMHEAITWAAVSLGKVVDIDKTFQGRLTSCCIHDTADAAEYPSSAKSQHTRSLYRERCVGLGRENVSRARDVVIKQNFSALGHCRNALLGLLALCEIAAFFFILTIFNPISANVHMFILFITYGIKDDEEQEVTVTTSNLIIFQ